MCTIREPIHPFIHPSSAPSLSWVTRGAMSAAFQLEAGYTVDKSPAYHSQVKKFTSPKL